MVPALIAALVGSTAATVGIGAAAIVESKEAAGEGMENQAEMTELDGWVKYGAALLSAPGGVHV